MGGQYFDPLTVACPFCKTKAAYPLEELDNYRAYCIHCQKSLMRVSRRMDQSRYNNKTELSHALLKFELLDDHILNDLLTDEKFDELSTLGELNELLNQLGSKSSLESLGQHPALSPSMKYFCNQPLDTVRLDDIALIQTPLKKIPFDQFALVGARIFTGETFLDNHSVIIDKDTIKNIIPTDQLPDDLQKIELHNGILAPGFIDLQVNGGGGDFFTHKSHVTAIQNMLDAHRSKGTTSLLPTLVSESFDSHQKATQAVLASIAAGFKGVLGIHFEGPFFSLEKRGAHAEKFIRRIDPADINWFHTIAGHHDLKIVLTLAPETIPQGVIQQLSEKGIVVFAGHTDATYEQIQVAINEGLHGFTHLYNAMRQMTARDPGVVGAALENNDAWCGIILDGHHVHPTAARIACELKKDKLFLVSDAMATVGSKSKSFALYDEDIAEIIDDASPKLINQQGKLAGSAIGLIDAVRYATVTLGLELAESLRMASLYPARCLELDNQLGKIEPGYRADLVHFTENFKVTSTWVAGDWQIHPEYE